MVGRSAADHSVVERSAADHSVVERSAAERSAADRSAADRSVVGRISQAFSTRLFMKMNSRVLLCRWIFTLGGEEVVLAQK